MKISKKSLKTFNGTDYEEEGIMATYTLPHNAPIIIREDRHDQFMAKSKKATISAARRKKYLEYAESMRTKNEGEKE